MDHRYMELSGEIASARQFCEFLDAGGRVQERNHDGLWRDVTSEVLRRERRRIEELECARGILPPLAMPGMGRPMH